MRDERLHDLRRTTTECSPLPPPLSFLSCRLAALLSCSLLDPCKSLHSLSGLTATAPGRGTRCGASCFSVAGLTRKAPHNTRQDTSPRRFVYPSSWFRLLAWFKRMPTGFAGSRDRLFRCGLSLAGRAAGGGCTGAETNYPVSYDSFDGMADTTHVHACVCVCFTPFVFGAVTHVVCIRHPRRPLSRLGGRSAPPPTAGPTTFATTPGRHRLVPVRLLGNVLQHRSLRNASWLCVPVG